MIRPKAIAGRIGTGVFLCACFCLSVCRSPAATLD